MNYNENKKILVPLLVMGLLIAIYIGYTYYQESQYENSFKMHVYYSAKAGDAAKQLDYYTTSAYVSTNTFDATKQQVLAYVQQENYYMNKTVQNDREMLNYASNDYEKEYARILLRIDLINLQIIAIQHDMYSSMTPNMSHDQDALLQIKRQSIEDLRNQIIELDPTKDKIKIEHPEFMEKIHKLTEDALNA